MTAVERERELSRLEGALAPWETPRFPALAA